MGVKAAYNHLVKAKDILEKEQVGGQIGGILPFLIPIIAGLGKLLAVAAPIATKGALLGAATYGGTKVAEKIAGRGFVKDNKKQCLVCKKLYVNKHTCPRKKGKGTRIVAKPQ